MLEVLEDKPAGLVIKELLFEPLGMDCSANFLFGDYRGSVIRKRPRS